MKIGDGTKAWNELPYAIDGGGSSSEVDFISYTSFSEFPSIGNSNFIYRAINEKALYQWNSTSNEYEALTGSNIDNLNIDFIVCGTSEDLTN